MKINRLLIILTLSTVISCHSTVDIVRSDNPLENSVITEKKIIPNSVYIYKNGNLNIQIKTLLCHKKEDELSLPILNLNTDNQLLISFDDLDADIKDYYYTIIHCNSDWSKSDLMQNEYIGGFTDKPITDYEFSFNTIQKYTHYTFNFPDDELKPMLSGNYVFKIFEEGGETIAYKRFMILETKLSIESQVRRATLAEDRNTKHEIDFIIKHPNLFVADPFSDIKVIIKQNNKEDNSITDLSPIYVKNNELIYDYEDDNTFLGNNEFRHFDIKSLRFQSDRIREITYDSTYNHVYLFNDLKRSFDSYSIEPDINGMFLIKSQEGWKTSTEADYAFVHFNLLTDSISYGDMYIIGGFSDWQLKDEFRLRYNTKKRKYEGKIYLKQGYYNYHYALRDAITNEIDVAFIEGAHYQTRNDYYVYVYYRSASDRYDRFVGFLKTSSKELF
ncbi:MAG: Uncharacterised protein [Cryomorphaceae bacterium]|nr:MAG: Uncharacterised protein [Cryomorphaceae bacterium]